MHLLIRRFPRFIVYNLSMADTLRALEWLGGSGKLTGKDVEGSGPTGTKGRHDRPMN
jgi:hypothetical protein